MQTTLTVGEEEHAGVEGVHEGLRRGHGEVTFLHIEEFTWSWDARSSEAPGAVPIPGSGTRGAN